MDASEPRPPRTCRGVVARRKDEGNDDEDDEEASEPRPPRRMPGRRMRGEGRKRDNDDDDAVQDNDSDV